MIVKRANFILLFVIVATLPNFGEGELVQIITPERVEIVTPQTAQSTQNATERNSTVPTEELDSYLKALKESRAQIRAPANIKRKDPDVVYGKPNEDEKPYSTVDHSSEIEDSKYPVITYDQGYKPPRPYLPPSPPQIYGPAAPVHFPELQPQPSPPSYGTPYSNPGSMFPPLFQLPMLSLFPMLPKIDIQMIAKLVLKLVLFKMLVKFLAVICLLLVIPTLGKKKPDDDDDDDHDDRERQIDYLTNLIWDGIAKNSTEVVTDEDMEEENITEEFEGNEMNEISGNELEEKEEIAEAIADVAEDKTSTTNKTAMDFVE